MFLYRYLCRDPMSLDFKIKCKYARFLLFIFGLIFTVFFYFCWYNVYGRLESIQLWSILVLLAGLSFCLIIGSKIEVFIGRLKDNVVGAYFSSLITLLIGFVGFVGIMNSILFGSYYIEYEKVRIEVELQKIVFQGWIWFFFTLYFISVVFVLFVIPLKNKMLTNKK